MTPDLWRTWMWAFPLWLMFLLGMVLFINEKKLGGSPRIQTLVVRRLPQWLRSTAIWIAALYLSLAPLVMAIRGGSAHQFGFGYSLSRGVSLWLEAVAVLVLPFALTVHIIHLASYLRHRNRPRKPRFQPRLVNWPVGVYALICTGILGVMIIPNAIRVVPFAAGWLIFVLIGFGPFWRAFNARGRVFELEPCPLRDELEFIAARFGVRYRSILVRTYPDSWVAQMSPLYRMLGRLVLVLDQKKLSDLDPDQLTAHYAWRHAQGARLGSPRAYLQRIPALPTGFAILIHGLQIWGLLETRLVEALIYSARSSLVSTILLGAVFLLPLATTWALFWLLGSFPNMQQMKSAAFEVWRDADPKAARNLEAFNAHLASRKLNEYEEW